MSLDTKKKCLGFKLLKGLVFCLALVVILQIYFGSKLMLILVWYRIICYL